MAFNVICSNQPPQLATGRFRTTNSNETLAVTKEQNRKPYLKKYMEIGRRNNKQNRALQAKRSENIKKKKQENLKGGHLIDK